MHRRSIRWHCADQWGRTLNANAEHATALAFTASGKLLASSAYTLSGASSTVGGAQFRLWDVATAGLLEEFAMSAPITLRGLAFGPSADDFAASLLWGTSEAFGIVWTEGREHRLSVHSGLVREPLTDIRVDSKQRLFATSADGSLGLWSLVHLGNAVGYERLATADGEFGSVLALDLSRDEEHAVVGYKDGRIRMWQLAEPAERSVETFLGHGLAFVGNTKILVTADHLKDFSKSMRAEPRSRFMPPAGPLEVLDHGAKLAFGRAGLGTISIWDLAAPREIRAWSMARKFALWL